MKTCDRERVSIRFRQKYERVLGEHDVAVTKPKCTADAHPTNNRSANDWAFTS
jgi:hypothetical protein